MAELPSFLVARPAGNSGLARHFGCVQLFEAAASGFPSGDHSPADFNPL
jgi:hypothetical protein